MPLADKILLIDCAGKFAQAGILSPNKPLIQTKSAMIHGYASALMPMIIDMLDAHAINRNAIGQILVNVGPGSFTGLRVSIATARGLALGLGIEAIGCAAMPCYAHAASIPKTHSKLLVLIDTRRGDFFAQSFDRDPKNQWCATSDQWRATSDIAIWDEDTIRNFIQAHPDISITGDGAQIIASSQSIIVQDHIDLSAMAALTKTQPALPIYASPAQTR